MEVVLKYCRLYPEDRVVVVGETAAHLHLNLHRMCLPSAEEQVHKIELSLATTLTWRAILGRWTALLPESYQAYKTDQTEAAFTLRSVEETNVFCISVNAEDFKLDADTVNINGFKVTSLDALKTRYLMELVKERQDLEMARRNFIVLDEEDMRLLAKRCGYFSGYLQLLCQVPL